MCVWLGVSLGPDFPFPGRLTGGVDGVSEVLVVGLISTAEAALGNAGQAATTTPPSQRARH